MSNIEKIKAEIERLKAENRNIRCQHNDKYCNGYDDAFNDLLPIIESLSKEKPSEDLEEEIKNYFEGLWPGTETAEQCNTDLHFTPPAIIRLVRHFTEWQYQKDRREFAKLKAKEWSDGYNEGIAKGKEQMMKGLEEDAPLLERVWLTLDYMASDMKNLQKDLENLKKKYANKM